MLKIDRTARRVACLAGLVAALAAAPTEAFDPKDPVTPLSQKEFLKPDLYISTQNLALADMLTQLPNRMAWEAFLQDRGRTAIGRRTSAYIDPRSGAATSIIGSFPLIPGDGVANGVTLAHVSSRLGRTVSAVDAAVVAELVRQFVVEHREILGIDPAQIGEFRAEPVHADLWHVSARQEYRGLPVRHGFLAAVVSHGNLILVGTEIWGTARVDVAPRLTAEQALDAGFAYADGRQPEDVVLAAPRLEVVPYAPVEFQEGEGFAGPVGAGYGYRLAWAFVFVREPEIEQWELLVDAHSGEVLALEDKNKYVAKQATGGVYPLTNTDICPTPQTCGVMQLNTPMPFVNTGLSAPNDFTNSAGVFDYTSGTVTSTLNGRYIRMNDTCGAISLSSTTGDLAFGGTNGQHDCVTPGVGGAGNTPASRSGFYELNKIAEQARGYLPNNTWLQNQLGANMNILQTCNANWNGSTVQFFRSGGGCRNTGEIAAVFDHEWGHGLDDNDTGGGLSSSSEGYADIAAILRLQASCVGHGFSFPTTPPGTCGLTLDGTGNNRNETQNGTATHCNVDCSGVRDADWAKHADNTPDTPLGFVCSRCNVGGNPCGRQVHCAAAPSRQAAWDFATRDLRSAPFNMSSETAFIVANKVFYQGSGLIGLWHACTCGVPGSSNGCGATNGYMQWLAADDDNGDPTDGTPHMTALFAAFNRHEIACATPAPVNSGCGGGPTAATTLTGTAGNNQVTLNWSAVTGATRYWVFRTEGFAGCDFGKALIAEVTGLTYTDNQVANGRPYAYNVVPAGASAACFGPASNCLTLTPQAIATFGLSCNPSSLTAPQGGNATSTCTVQSLSGFSAAVNLSCAGLPAGVTCSYNPGSVTPAPNGTATSTLTVNVGAAVPAGNYAFQAQGVSGAITQTFAMDLTVVAVSVAPQALAVDSAGNNVFEPSETAVMTPTWRNTGQGAIALTGATSNFTGPAGATYDNPDAAASYGTIAANGQAACTDCYSVNVTAPTRPATHWDGTIQETMTPTSTVKDWVLHVGGSFTDVPPANLFYRFVETILHKNVTGGCTTTAYCPAASTTREQMAVFVLVSKEAPGYTPPACGATPMFNDVPASSPFCRWIEELALRQVVSGCGGGNYCPTAPASREQMAVFVLRTLDPTLNPVACTTPMFNDVPAASPFCRWIEELSRRGVVTGCGGGNYCPTADVSREQMSVFLAVTFGLTLYGL